MNRCIKSQAYQDVICLPCSGAENNQIGPGIKGGLYQADGTPIPEGFLYRQSASACLKQNGNISYKGKDNSPVRQIQFPNDIGETKQELTGTYIYAGLLVSHFGHFLLESLAHLWFIKLNPDLPILWVAAHQQQELSTFQKEILSLLKIKNTIHILTEQSKIEKLIVSQTGYMVSSEFSALQKQALKVFDQVHLKPGKKLWLSRKDVLHGRFLNEQILEEYLTSEGWTIYQPEKYSITEQLQYIQDAEHLAGIEGSAHHLLILLPGYQGKVSIFPRGPKINGDFLTIAEMLGLKQTVYFETTADCTPKYRSWQKDWCWLDMNHVLQCLGISPKPGGIFRWVLTTTLQNFPHQTRWKLVLRITTEYLTKKIKRISPAKFQLQSVTESENSGIAGA